MAFSGSRTRLPLRLTLITLALCAVAAYPTYALGGRGALAAMCLGAALSAVTILSSYGILALAFRNVPQFQTTIVVGGFVLRLAIFFALLALVARTLVVDLEQVVLWMVTFYFVLVILEAWWLAAQARSSRRPEA